eukprot:276926-Amphidinium_carterae.2
MTTPAMLRCSRCRGGSTIMTISLIGCCVLANCLMVEWGSSARLQRVPRSMSTPFGTTHCAVTTATGAAPHEATIETQVVKFVLGGCQNEA